MRSLLFFISAYLVFLGSAQAAVQGTNITLKDKLQARMKSSSDSQKSTLIFDIPVTYNRRVSYWIQHYQTKGNDWFREWLEKANRYMPLIQKELKAMGLPQDLAFMVMIESGFDSNAYSHASAVGPWQFIQATALRYNLKINAWLDERRDLKKSTQAAIRYMKDLYKEFGSWYLVAASYNMGETGLRRRIQKFQTKDFWALCRLGALPQETMDYVPKILAAMMIAKSPSLYGFNDLTKLQPLDYELVTVKGDFELNDLADHLGITRKSLKDLNAELLLGYVPRQVEKHVIRVPVGAAMLASELIDRKNPTKTAKLSNQSDVK